MTEQTARERIEGVLQACLSDDATPGGERFDRLVDKGTDNVIAIVREALLSKAAIEAAEEAAGQDEDWDGLAFEFHNGEGAILAALDAAFGKEERDG